MREGMGYGWVLMGRLDLLRVAFEPVGSAITSAGPYFDLRLT